MNISVMTIDDLNIIKDNLFTDFDNFWNYNNLKDELISQNSYVIVSKNDNNEITGFADIKVILDEGDIMNIVVKKSYRKNGIGSALLEHLISYANSKNLKTVTLEVNEHNQPALILYKKFGFEQVGVRTKYYGGEDNAIIMTKIL